LFFGRQFFDGYANYYLLLSALCLVELSLINILEQFEKNSLQF